MNVLTDIPLPFGNLQPQTFNLKPSTSNLQPQTFNLLTFNPIVMATIERFEDLDVWKNARKLTNRVYEHTRQEPFSKDFGLRDQI